MKKSQSIVMLLILVLAIIIVISFIYIININLNDNSTSDSISSSNYKLSDDEINSLISLVNIYDNYLITFDGTKNIKEMSNLDKINFIDRLPNSIKKDLELDFNEGVSLKQIEKILKKYFGNDTIFEPVNSECYLGDGEYLIYDSNTKMYKANNDYHAHSAYMAPSIVNYYQEGKRIVNNDKLIYIISLKKAFAWSNSSIYYGSYKDLLNSTNKIVNLYDKYGDYNSDDINLLLSDYIDNFNSYTYVFETKDSLFNSYLVELSNSNIKKDF